MSPIDLALSLPTAYTRAEMETLWWYVESLHQNATVIEYGVDYGASASLYFSRAAQVGGLNIILVDNRCMNPDTAIPAFHGLVDKFPEVSFEFQECDSKDAVVPATCDLLHVDASHSYEDTLLELQSTRARITVIHDFDRSPVFEGVGRACREHFKREPDLLTGTCAVYLRVV